jgi:hypothetical protein
MARFTQEEIDEAMYACSHEPINSERYKKGQALLKEIARERARTVQMHQLGLEDDRWTL